MTISAVISFFLVSARGLSVEQWGILSLKFDGPSESSTFNPFDDVELFGIFTSKNHAGATNVRGFFDGGTDYKIRFMPNTAGEWEYKTESNNKALDSKSGTFTVTASTSRGIANVDKSNPKSFRWSDGSPYFPVGTTSYAWVQANTTIQQATLSTLRSLNDPHHFGFNKLRTLVFPKWYEYTRTEPSLYAYEGTPLTQWNFRRFNVKYWQMLDDLFLAVAKEEIMIEPILFHPYDGGHWGFDCMGGRDVTKYNTSNDELYIKYFVARVGSIRNLWWSMANEWDHIHCKQDTNLLPSTPIWDRLFEVLKEEDPYNHELSIHNGYIYYNNSRPWISHFSFQSSGKPCRDWWKRWNVVKPCVWDEFGYEGDIAAGWGSNPPQVEVDKFWRMNGYGGFAAGHSECILEKGVNDDDQIMWWNHGNILRGQTPVRARFFHEYMVNETRHPLFHELTASSPVAYADVLAKEDQYYLFHFCNTSSGQTLSFPLRSGLTFHVTQIDWYGMKLKSIGDVRSEFKWNNKPNDATVVELLVKK